MNRRLLPQDRVFLDPNLTQRQKIVYFRDNDITPSPILVLDRKRDPNFQNVSSWLLLNTNMMNQIEDLQNDMKTGGAIKTVEDDTDEQVFPQRDRRMNQIEAEFRPLERRLRQIERRYEKVNGLLEMIIDTLNRNVDNPYTNNLMLQRHDDFSDELDALVEERERILARMQELRNEYDELL